MTLAGAVAWINENWLWVLLVYCVGYVHADWRRRKGSFFDGIMDD